MARQHDERGDGKTENNDSECELERVNGFLRRCVLDTSGPGP